MVGSDPSAAADYPRWVMLDRGGRWQEASTGDASTSAFCYGSTGNIVQVSFRLEAPPAVSTLHVDARPVPGCEIARTHNRTYHDVISVHRDSVFIQLCCYSELAPDFFVYNAGGAGGGVRPPRLFLLPPCGPDMCVGKNSTGILRRGGGDEFVVASLVVRRKSERPEDPVLASICLLRSGECKWEHWSMIPVRHADSQKAELLGWHTCSVVAVGDRFLYWIDLLHGVIFSDVTAEIPELRYVPLPADPLLTVTVDGNDTSVQGCHDPWSSRNVCVTAAGAVRFVRVSPRCCCGGPGATSCARSQRAFTITTWTLRMDDMTWEEDCVLDSGELWAVAAEAAGVPLVPPAFPVLSVEHPDMVCFVSRESIHRWRTLGDDTGDKTAWLLALDMKRKTLWPVCRYPEDDDDRLLHLSRQAFLPSEVSSYFNTACHGGNNPVLASQEGEEEMMEVSTEIREIPGMTRDEMLRAHSLVVGDHRRVRFLATLPVGMRKEYCMIMTELERSLELANDTVKAS